MVLKQFLCKITQFLDICCLMVKFQASCDHGRYKSHMQNTLFVILRQTILNYDNFCKQTNPDARSHTTP